ncbi:MAG: hypothetical protein GX115_03830 [Ruminiclostridium sp.]|nr:hypothetical protein [Ruminiclostridium sp.]
MKVVYEMKAFEVLKKNNGSSMVFYGIALSLLLGICALVVDIGRVTVEKSKFQNALDAAALAAIRELPNKNQAEATAKEYIEKNGFHQDDIIVTFENNDNEIHIQGTVQIRYLFARILSFNDVTVNQKAAAAGGAGRAFDYALFSGSTSQALIINGGGTGITGSTHTNQDFILHGGKSTITGACEAAGTLTITGNNVNIGSEVPGAPFVDMPDFTDIIKEQAQACGTFYNSGKVYDNNVTVNSSIYVNGEINVNSARFSGTGCLLAKNSIVFNGSSLYSAPSDAICFYSETGNIIFNGANSEIHGIIYAPNGTVIFNGAKQTVYGRVIAKNIIFNGTGLTVISGSDDLDSLPIQAVRLIQ